MTVLFYPIQFRTIADIIGELLKSKIFIYQFTSWGHSEDKKGSKIFTFFKIFDRRGHGEIKLYVRKLQELDPKEMLDFCYDITLLALCTSIYTFLLHQQQTAKTNFTHVAIEIFGLNC